MNGRLITCSLASPFQAFYFQVLKESLSVTILCVHISQKQSFKVQDDPFICFHHVISVLHSAHSQRYYVYYIVLIKSHQDIFRYISGHGVLDEDTIKIEQKCTRFFYTFSLGVFGVLRVYRENYSIPNKAVESAKKLVTLPT